MKRFEIVPNGDPLAEDAWDVREYPNGYDDPYPVFCGDLSPIHGRSNAVEQLTARFPGCQIREELSVGEYRMVKV